MFFENHKGILMESFGEQKEKFAFLQKVLAFSLNGCYNALAL